MTLLGLDFDNTLVSYDEIFHKIALERGLISTGVSPNKIEIRDYLRGQGKDEEFTLMQGEIYGNRILEAKPMDGMIKALWQLKKRGIKMVIVSHKTKTPYKGPKYDLREAAYSWLKHHKFFDQDVLDWTEDEIHFADTKEEKVGKIIEIGCDAYIDDLREILEKLPENMLKIHYDKDSISKVETSSIKTLGRWDEAGKFF